MKVKTNFQLPKTLIPACQGIFLNLPWNSRMMTKFLLLKLALNSNLI